MSKDHFPMPIFPSIKPPLGTGLPARVQNFNAPWHPNMIVPSRLGYPIGVMLETRLATVNVQKQVPFVLIADKEDTEEEEEEVEYRHERLPTDLTAPCFEHMRSVGN
jgi:hypothetical protein